jgi:adenylate kinase
MTLEKETDFSCTEMAMVTKNDLAGEPRARVILMLGAPGSGKGTQSSFLSKQLGIPCLSTGEILRSEAKRNTPAGFRLRQVLASGSLVSDEMVCAVVGSRLRREGLEHGLILDGFPRTVQQAAYLDSLLADLGLPRPMVIHLDASDDGLLRRLTGRRQCAVCGEIYNLISRPSRRGSRCEKDGGALVQRDDDSEGVIASRLREFEHNSAPLIDYYQGPEYYRVPAERKQEEIAAELLSLVGGASVYSRLGHAATNAA